MTSAAFSRRLQQLIQQLDNHPHREEILRMAMEQLIDDQSVMVAEAE
jgi:hypothetical protein